MCVYVYVFMDEREENRLMNWKLNRKLMNMDS